MSDGYFEDEYDDDSNYVDESSQQQNQGGPRALREAYDAKTREVESLKERLAKLEKKDHLETLADRLKNAGAKNPEALGKWADKINPDEADEFWAAVRAASGEAPEPTAPALSEEDAAALAAVSGEPSGTAPVTTGDSAANLAAIDNEADFWKAIRGS